MANQQPDNQSRPLINDKDMDTMDPRQQLGKAGTIWEEYGERDREGRLISSTVPSYPSIFTPPSVKQTGEYALKQLRAWFYSCWNTYGNGYGNNYRLRWIDNRNFSNGKWDPTPYIGGKKKKTDEKQNPLLKHLDFDPVTEQSKYRDIFVSYAEELDYMVSATSLNPMAAASRLNKKLNEIVIHRQKQSGFSQAMDQKAGQPVMPQSTLPFPVSDEKEIDLFYQLEGGKEVYELQIELANQVVANDSDLAQITKLHFEDDFDCGEKWSDIVYDKDGRIREKYVDPVNATHEEFRGHWLNRPNHISYIDVAPIQEIYMESDGQFTLDQMHQLAKLYEGKFGNPAWNNTYNNWVGYFNTDSSYLTPNGVQAPFFMNWNIPRMFYRWQEIDMYYTIEYTNASGLQVKTFKTGGEHQTNQEFLQTLPNEGIYAPHPMYFENVGSDPSVSPTVGSGSPASGAEGVAANSQNQPSPPTSSRLQIHRYYRATWILNTRYVYDYGRNPIPARDPYNNQYELCPTKVYRTTQQPMAERIKELVKEIYVAGKKMDNELAGKVPAAWKINIKGMENLALGQGEFLTVKQNFEIFQQKGYWFYADEAQGDILGQTKNKPTIDAVTNQGFLESINGYISYINFKIGRIAALTGINEFMDASNPNPQTPVALAQQAQQGTKNSFGQLISGFLFFREKIALDVSERVRQVVIATGNYSGYADSIGTAVDNFVTITGDIIPHRFGIKVYAAPSRAEKETMRQHIAQAFSNIANTEQGGLWVTDLLRFEEYLSAKLSFKLIRLMLASVITDRMNKAQQAKMDLIDKQVKGNQQQAQTAQQGEIAMSQEQLRQKMIFEHFLTGEITKRNASLAFAKGNVKLITDRAHADNQFQQKQLLGAND